MPDRVIGALSPESTTRPAERAPARPLPPDLLRDASRRLQVLSLLAAALWVVGFALYHVALRAMDPLHQWHFPLGSDLFVIAGALFSLGLYFYARGAEHDPRRVLNLGLAYMVLTAALISQMLHWDPTPHGPVTPTISWIGTTVIIFPAIVPSTPVKTAIASLIAVSMNPVAMLIARARGRWDFPHASDALLMHYPDLLLAIVATVIAHVVTGLGQQVARARELGSYQLGEILGRGGMGNVYRATHRMLARPAAIKLIRAETMSDKAGDPGGTSARLAIKRFKREAQAAASLRSPHTVELYDFGVTHDGTFYFVMELLDGLELESLVKRFGPLPAARVIPILRQVCESLAEAHAAGLVHRDIKPANIHLGRLGLRHDFVKVLDFGLVKSIAHPGPELQDSLQTGMGLTPGTPAYMAPEVALGHAFDGRSDLYALGCVAYYLLTGSRVFEGDAPLQILARHIQETPLPPSALTELPVPAELERIVLWCLAKSPADRPQTAGDLERALAAIDTGAWGEEQAAEWWRTVEPKPGVVSTSSRPATT
jgi:serine/threonine-protein kinase